jgi:hypothetical protein
LGETAGILRRRISSVRAAPEGNSTFQVPHAQSKLVYFFANFSAGRNKGSIHFLQDLLLTAVQLIALYV